MIVNEKEALLALTTLRANALNLPDGFDHTTFPPSKETITALYRAAARATHPDHGGDGRSFALVDRAKHVLQAYAAKVALKPVPAAQSQPCDACAGRGHIVMQSRRIGQPGLRRQCIKCSGSGDAFYDTHGLHT